MRQGTGASLVRQERILSRVPMVQVLFIFTLLADTYSDSTLTRGFVRKFEFQRYLFEKVTTKIHQGHVCQTPQL